MKGRCPINKGAGEPLLSVRISAPPKDLSLSFDFSTENKIIIDF